MDSLLQSFPGAVEISAVRALALRVTQLEKIVQEPIGEERAKLNADRSRKQLMISLAALGTTVVVWLLFIGLELLY